MALKNTKLDLNGVQLAISFKKRIIIARQLLVPPPDPVCDAHELNPFA